MAGLANPTEPVTEIEPDDEVHELLRSIIAEMKLMNLQLGLITKFEITADELEV